MKAVYVALIVFACVGAVKLGGDNLSARLGGSVIALFILSVALVPLSYWAGSVAEAYVKGFSGAELLRHVLRFSGLFLLGPFVMLIAFMAASGPTSCSSAPTVAV